MSNGNQASREAEISSLLGQTGAAHEVYERDELNGQYDADWPRWYAAYLLEHGLPALLGKTGNHETLKRPLDQVLMEADAKHRADAPGENWRDYYARYLLGIADTL